MTSIRRLNIFYPEQLTLNLLQKDSKIEIGSFAYIQVKFLNYAK